MKKVLSENELVAIRISAVSIGLNALLFGVKLFGGLWGGSLALLSDAANSVSDVISTIIVIIGICMAAKAEDADHEFGHERYECVAAIILSVIVFATGVGIGYGGISSIATKSYDYGVNPDVITLSSAIFAIVVKGIMFAYTYAPARRIKSDALRADAFNHLSDSLSSVGSLIGIIGAMCGLPVLDSIAAIIICFLVIKAAYDIFRDAVNKMTDKACDKETEDLIYNFMESCNGVMRVDSLKTRQFASRVYVIAEIACDGNLTLYDAHSIAERVHSGVERTFPQVKHIHIHVNPYSNKE